MKSIFACLMASAFTLSAQSNLDAIFTQALKQTAAALKPIPAEDQQVVIAETAALLQKHVTFRPDGTASSFSTISSIRQSLEWQNLRIKAISPVALSDADRMNGEQKRYHAILTCDAARQWDPKTNTWTPWRTTDHLLFPTAIIVTWKNGVVTANGGTYLPKFSPGPGPSIQQSQPNKPTQTAPSDLPPGVTRGK